MGYGVIGSEPTDVPNSAKEPHNQNNKKDSCEYPPDAIRSAAGVIAASIISKSTTKENDQQY
jgi:hypothetical protein